MKLPGLSTPAHQIPSKVYWQIAAILTLVLFSLNTYSQISKEERIQDSVIGWDAKNYYDRNYKPQTTPDGKQRDLYINKMAEWLKASYTPVGSLGEYQRFVGKLGFGLRFQPWNVGYDYLDAQKKFRPIPEENVPAHFTANLLYGAWEIDFMSKKGESFLTMQPNGYSPNSTEDKNRKELDPRVHPNVYNVLPWINEWITIYIAPGNKLPIKPVSKRELLDKAAASLDRVLENISKDETQRWTSHPQNLESVMKSRTEEINKIRNNIISLKEKYKNSLDEQAMVVNYQLDWRSFTTGSWDIFKSGPNTTYYPVYKLDAETMEKMKGSKPLWLAFAVPYATQADGTAEYELYTSIIQHINYDYIYNYFFDPEKVKDKPYTPNNAIAMKTRLDAYRNKNNQNIIAKTNTGNLPANVYFQEDFSRNATGSAAADWHYNRAGTTPFTITDIPAENGKWLKLGYGRAIRPALLKGPWPKNFTLEYDVVTGNNYTGRTGGAVDVMITSRKLDNYNGETKTDAPKDASITIRVESGNDVDYKANSNYRGLLRVKVLNIPDINEENYVKGINAEYRLTEFTDKNKKVHISVQVRNGAVTISVNGKQVIKQTDFKMTYGGACKLCGVPAELQFNNLTFNNVTNESDAVGVYIGNVKIVKE